MPPRDAAPAATWPDGRICDSCYYEATSRYGNCPSCGFHRLLPGRMEFGDQAVCRDFEHGLDSRGMLEIRTHVESETGILLSPKVIATHNNVLST